MSLNDEFSKNNSNNEKMIDDIISNSGSSANGGIARGTRAYEEATGPAETRIEEEFSEFAKVSLARRIVDRILYFIFGMVPVVGDHPLEFIRKCLFVLALTTLIVSSAYILNDTVVMPAKSDSIYSSIADLYDREDDAVFDDSNFAGSFPAGIMNSMKGVYAKNPDTRGFLSYNLNSKNSMYKDIRLPVVNSNDNKDYLYHDFYKSYNIYGTLFFDMQNNLDYKENFNKVLIIHGHNMDNGSMFSGLNEFLVENNADVMRNATMIQLDTLYEKRTYEVFSVFIDDVLDRAGYFDYLRTEFSDEGFKTFVDDIRLRSIYDFPHMNVGADDELLILSTCTDKMRMNKKYRRAYLEDGRTIVVAKRVANERVTSEDEKKSINYNKDALMPREWYVNRQKELHPLLVN